MKDYRTSDFGDGHYYVTEFFAAVGATSGQVYSSGRLTLKESKIEEEEEERKEKKQKKKQKERKVVT